MVPDEPIQRTDAPILRTVGSADLAIVLHHRRAMFEEMGYRDVAALDAMEATSRPYFAAALADGSYRGWLVEVDGNVVAGGGLLIVPFPSNPIDPVSRRGWIVNVYTETAHRGHGHARRIVSAIVTWCREQGFPSVALHASDAGRSLYASMGFEPTNEMRLRLG